MVGRSSGSSQCQQFGTIRLVRSNNEKLPGRIMRAVRLGIGVCMSTFPSLAFLTTCGDVILELCIAVAYIPKV